MPEPSLKRESLRGITLPPTGRALSHDRRGDSRPKENFFSISCGTPRNSATTKRGPPKSRKRPYLSNRRDAPKFRGPSEFCKKLFCQGFPYNKNVATGNPREGAGASGSRRRQVNGVSHAPAVAVVYDKVDDVVEIAQVHDKVYAGGRCGTNYLVHFVVNYGEGDYSVNFVVYYPVPFGTGGSR